MLTQKRHDQGINVLSQTDYLPILIASFLTDQKSQGFADETVKFYKMNVQSKILLRSVIRQLVIALELLNKIPEDDFRELVRAA